MSDDPGPDQKPDERNKYFLGGMFTGAVIVLMVLFSLGWLWSCTVRGGI